MTWTTKKFNTMVEKAKTHILKEFKTTASELPSDVFIASSEELQQESLIELELLKYTKSTIEKIRTYYLPHIIGKYFRISKQIWVLHGKGETMETLIHELLHSIQKCEPNREGIVDYLTYKILGSTGYIDPYELRDWEEIERTSSFRIIKGRLIMEGDCEDF